MNRVFVPESQILPTAQRALWQALAGLADLGFVLYGGTAIALRLGHRQSIDFDFFSERALDRIAIASAMPSLKHAITLQDQLDAWTVLVPTGSDQDQVKVSFFGNIRFGRVAEPAITDDGVLWVAALEDLLPTKLKVILQRAEAKDYIDIAAMIEADVDLSRGLAAATLMFAPSFQPSECLKGLTFFADGDLHTLSRAQKRQLIRSAGGVRDLPEVRIVSKRLRCALD